jgi:hypothetical protein
MPLAPLHNVNPSGRLCFFYHEPWNPDIKNWPIKLAHQKLHFNIMPWTQSVATDASLLGRTVTLLGNKARISCQEDEIDTISGIITKGIQDAGVSGVLEEPSLGGQRLLDTATHTIDESYE